MNKLKKVKEVWKKEVVKRFEEGLKSLDIILVLFLLTNTAILLLAFWKQIIATIGVEGIYFLLGIGITVLFFILFMGEEVYLVDELFGDITNPVKQHLGFLPFWRKPYQINGKAAIQIGVFPKHEVVLEWGDWKQPYVVKSFVFTKIYGKIRDVEKKGFWSKRIYITPLLPKQIVVPKIKKAKIHQGDSEKEIEVIEKYEKKSFDPNALIHTVNLVNAVSTTYEQTIKALRKELELARREIAEKDRILAELSSVIREHGIRSSHEFIRHTKGGFAIASEVLGLSADALIDIIRKLRERLQELEELAKTRVPLVAKTGEKEVEE